MRARPIAISVLLRQEALCGLGIAVVRRHIGIGPIQELAAIDKRLEEVLGIFERVVDDDPRPIVGPAVALDDVLLSA